MKKYILAIDQGTTGSRAFIFDEAAKVVGSAYQEFKQYYPHPGWVEHDATEIWQSCENVIRKAVNVAGISPGRITAIGITNQRETTVLWNRRTAKPVHRAIVWQCRRTAEWCARPAMQKVAPLIRKKTGLVLDAYFSGTKIKWLLDHVPGLRAQSRQGEVCFGTIDSWLIWKLTGAVSHVTDMTNASRTLIFNIHSKSWDPELLKIFNVPVSILPKALPSCAMFGRTAKGVAGLPKGIPITAVMGDQQAALYGQGCHEAGMSKNTYGTGCFLVLNTALQCVTSQHGLITTLACDAMGQPVYALEGSVFIAGAVVQWLRDELQMISSSSEAEAKIRGVADTQGVYFVPAFTGLGAPYWDGQARGAIVGLTRGANAKHIIRAALESIAYQSKDVFDLMQNEYGKKIKTLNVDGGACKNNFLMQFQADILGCPVTRPQMIDTTASGAAFLAGVSVGLWKPKELIKLQKVERTFVPKMSSSTVKGLYRGWQKAVRQVRAN